MTNLNANAPVFIPASLRAQALSNSRDALRDLSNDQALPKSKRNVRALSKSRDFANDRAMYNSRIARRARLNAQAVCTVDEMLADPASLMLNEMLAARAQLMVNEPVNDPVNDPVNEPVNDPVNDPVGDSTDCSENESYRLEDGWC